jgi:hypothetical protein
VLYYVCVENGKTLLRILSCMFQCALDATRAFGNLSLSLSLSLSLFCFAKIWIIYLACSTWSINMAADLAQCCNRI